MKFLLSRIMQIIGKSEINKYLKFTLSKVTYEKYLIQWKIITNILLENKKKIYHVNEKKKIEKIINDFNYDIDKNEKIK